MAHLKTTGPMLSGLSKRYRLWLPLFLSLFFLTFPSGVLWATNQERSDTEDQALRLSQGAVGQSLENLTLKNRQGEPVALASFRGKPLLISLIYTRCYHTCSVVTRSLAMVVEKAQDIFGEDSFHVVTAGFDTRYDRPETMRHFARQQGITHKHWAFLSGDASTLEQLVRNVGFSFSPSPKGFDHLVQATIVDANGIIYRQVYGETIPTPQLLEPLKELILGVPPAQESAMGTLIRRVRLFCTTYDPRQDAYRYDYSLFIGLFIGAVIILSIVFFLFREIRRNKTFSKH